MKILLIAVFIFTAGISQSQIIKQSDSIPSGFKTDFMIRDPFQNSMEGFNFSIPIDCNVDVTITDIYEEQVYSANREVEAGEYSFVVPKNLNVSSGTYFFILKVQAIYVNVSFEGKTKFLIIR